MEVKKTTVEKVRELAQPIADELGFFLWDVRFEKEGATWYLRVLIDKDGGIDMDDCEAFTRPMNKVLDEGRPYISELCAGVRKSRTWQRA